MRTQRKRIDEVPTITFVEPFEPVRYERPESKKGKKKGKTEGFRVVG